uniref:Secreted protein n=1 Tax=Lutzomyia longipalpis TaxID=7200 RepID=A0A1B0CG31_LUTLO
MRMSFKLFLILISLCADEKRGKSAAPASRAASGIVGLGYSPRRGTGATDNGPKNKGAMREAFPSLPFGSPSLDREHRDGKCDRTVEHDNIATSSSSASSSSSGATAAQAASSASSASTATIVSREEQNLLDSSSAICDTAEAYRFLDFPLINGFAPEITFAILDTDISVVVPIL